MRPHVVAMLLLMVGANVAFGESADANLCATSFASRLQKTLPFLRRYETQIAYAMAEGFFAQHCRFLGPSERSASKLDDPTTYVCDHSSKEPKELADAVRIGLREGWFGSGVTWQRIFAETHPDLQHANEDCAPFDTAERVSLVLPVVNMRMPELDADGDHTAIRAWKRSVIEWQEALVKVMRYTLALLKDRSSHAGDAR
jgi:hypothetical protein